MGGEGGDQESGGRKPGGGGVQASWRYSDAGCGENLPGGGEEKDQGRAE